jgi:glyoxylase-like metal-dependent hydrolase (beta-lactamase superfamily II)
MIPLEDNFADVLGKAMVGTGLGESAAAKNAGLDTAQVRALLDGRFDEDAARALASALGLKADALVRLGRGDYRPAVAVPSNLAQVTTPFGSMTVNAYVLWDAESRGAAIFDTGAEAAPILDLVAREKLDVAGIFLTHSHADHIHALAELQVALGVDAWSSQFEPVRGTNNFRPGDVFNAGRHFIRTRHTPGHSAGGATFVIEGKKIGAAIVGDALFAGSAGGIRGNYAEALQTIRREILSLPEDTIVCPGHGPMTTVGQEKANNPFF